DTSEVGSAVDTEQSGGLGVGERRQERDAPAEGSGSEAQRPKRVARVMLTIAVGAFPVLPSFPPMHRGEADEEGACGQPGGEGAHAALLRTQRCSSACSRGA